ncbi:ead/Ea22-like family protein [Escherichia phage YDC107_2]|nr:ead/Ea22-like family protein [Escherichia phage YDC107_2]
MSKINYQALREKAEKATCGVWSLEYGEGRFDGDDALIHREAAGYIPICRIEGAHPESRFYEDFQMEQQANAEFIAAANPATVLALLDERERNQQYIKRRDQENEDIALTVGKLRVELEEVKQHAEELSETKAVRNQWRPDICPITGRAFFMWIEHPTLGNVPTYGGPLDSYTIPTKDGDGEFSCERYDHDFGGWVESECLGLYLIDDREQCRVYELEERVKELEAREILLPERSSMLHRTDFHEDYQTVMAYKFLRSSLQSAPLAFASKESEMDGQISIVRPGACDDREIRIIIRLAMGKAITALITPENLALALTGKSDLPVELKLRNVEIKVK